MLRGVSRERAAVHVLDGRRTDGRVCARGQVASRCLRGADMLGGEEHARVDVGAEDLRVRPQKVAVRAEGCAGLRCVCSGHHRDERAIARAEANLEEAERRGAGRVDVDAPCVAAARAVACTRRRVRLPQRVQQVRVYMVVAVRALVAPVGIVQLAQLGGIGFDGLFPIAVSPSTETAKLAHLALERVQSRHPERRVVQLRRPAGEAQRIDDGVVQIGHHRSAAYPQLAAFGTTGKVVAPPACAIRVAQGPDVREERHEMGWIRGGGHAPR